MTFTNNTSKPQVVNVSIGCGLCGYHRMKDITFDAKDVALLLSFSPSKQAAVLANIKIRLD